VATTVVHLVTLLEEMPVTETMEALDHLRPTQIRVGTLVANMMIASPLSDHELDRAARQVDGFAVPGWKAADNRALAAEFGQDAARTREQRARQSRLEALGIPLVQLPFDPNGIDRGALAGLACQLREQMRLEAA